ncbi:MAG: DNA polymerase III subunit alpha, partial [Candidatus Phytoplasma stylosanthis]|nr:DNA polymerase III subunit alpha [Candidatus Phytoplasma stylosanthis]
DSYSENKKNNKNLLANDLDLKNSIGHILKNTYGIIIYQEQIMEIAVHISGYDFNEAEIFMKYIIQKNNKNISEDFIKQDFLENSYKKGYSKELSQKIFNYILKFSNYSFNKSHSVSYSLISYRMAFLKTHYLIHFLKVILDEVQNDFEKTNKILQKIKKKKLIQIYPPDVLISDTKYQILENKLILPLTLIKNVSDSIANFIIKERKKDKFKDFYDFKKKCFSILNNSLLKDFIFSGALDQFGLNKKNLFHESNLEDLEHEQYLIKYKKKIIYSEYSNLFLQKEVIRIFGFDLTSLIN